MRRLLPLVFAAVLIPAGAAAQKVPPVAPRVKQAPPAVTRIPQDQAVSTAVAKVRNELVNDQLASWGGGQGGGIRPASLIATSTLFNPTGGRAGVYVIAVAAPNRPHHVRVVVDAATGAVLSTTVASWDWGNAPTWWQKGEASPPPAQQ